MRIEKDGWLSDALGSPSWKVLDVTAAISCADIKAGLLARAEHGTAFFFARIPTGDVAAVMNATRAGFSVVDVNVIFDWDGGGAGASAITSKQAGAMTIGTAGPHDTAAIEAIAGRCFAFSRFHLDPAVGVERANEVKRRWARNACRGRANAVYVARRGCDVTGFLAVIENRSNAGVDAIIDLVGVDAGHQRQGVGWALSRMFVGQWRDRATRLRVGTQISNIPAMRLYESIGFKVAETSYVLHAHIRNGALAA